jgi:superfamily II DNA or RNA helicase
MIGVDPLNAAYVRLTGDFEPVRDWLAFEAPGARFHPAYRKMRNGERVWDGKTRLVSSEGVIRAGLLPRVQEWAAKKGVRLDYTPDTAPWTYTEDDVLKLFDKIDVPDQFEHRDYQIRSIVSALTHERRLFLSPTASGKSMVIYLLTQWFLNKKTLIVVPRVGLVHQMAADFIDYGCDPNLIHKIHEGSAKESDRPITIATYQSIIRLPDSWFKQFKMFIGDEAHGFKSKSLTAISDKLTNAYLRFGFTGTLDGKQVHQLILEGVFGSVEQVTTTYDLMEDGHVAQLDIDIIKLIHPKAEAKKLALEIKQARKANKEAGDGDLKKNYYQMEMDRIAACEPRNRFLMRLASSLPGNVLLLFHRIDHGDELFQQIARLTNRPLFFIDGGVDGELREDIRLEIERQDNAILLASFGTTAVGISIKRLNHLILGSPWKSRITTLQSIGRGLRIAEDKKSIKVYDVADDYSTGSWTNYTLEHLMERIKIYNSEMFAYRLFDINLEYET